MFLRQNNVGHDLLFNKIFTNSMTIASPPTITKDRGNLFIFKVVYRLTEGASEMK